MAATAHLDIDGGKITGNGEVSVSDFGFQTTRIGRVQGVNGKVKFANILDMTTEPDQVISVGAMNPGLPLNDGRIVFKLDGGKQLAVTTAAFPFAGGTLAMAPFTWTLGAETQSLEVTADGIELTKLVETLKLPDTEASGTVSGSFPLDIKGTKILIRNARLIADGNGGRLAYRGGAADQAASADESARMAFEALKDFDFTVLELGLDGDVRGNITVSLLLEGVSRKGITYGKSGQVLYGQAFQFNINIDSPLAQLFNSAKSLATQDTLTDIVVKQVKDQRDAETE